MLQGYQLWIIDKYDRKLGEWRPGIIDRQKTAVKLCCILSTVWRKVLFVGFEALHSSTEHEIHIAEVNIVPDLIQHLLRASGSHLNPDAGALLKLPNDRLVDLLFM